MTTKLEHEKVTCYYNGCTLTAEEIADPDIIDGEPYCRECYDSWRADSEVECPFCCDYFLDDDLSECFILVDDDFGEPGLYRPLSFPFYRQPMIGRPYLYQHAIERIGSLLPGQEFNCWTPAAYVCKECMGLAPEVTR